VDDLVDPAMVARNLESMRRAEQWMKVHGVGVLDWQPTKGSTRGR
jgi:hypothetical protein